MPHPFTDFKKWAGTEFEAYILPIIPAGATLKPPDEEGKRGSSIKPDQLGKIPGKWFANTRTWTGFPSWQTHRAGRRTMAYWERWQDEAGTAIASGIILGNWIAFDIDSDDQVAADAIELHISLEMGVTPVVRQRYGSSRRVLFYARDQHTAPIQKLRLAFKTEDDQQHIVEVLATGQQVIIEGPHSKGSMHYWRSGDLIENREWLKTNLITGDHVFTTMRRLRDWVDATPALEKIKLALPTGTDRAAAVSITDLMSPHRVTDFDVLERCVKAIDLNDERLADYDTWCALLRAIWGNYGVACPRFMEALAFMADGDETVIPLLQRWGGYALVGKLLDQCFLFIQGKSGTAKSAFSDILIRLMGSYGTPGSTTLFMKQSDKRSFELGDIAGKRGLFVPETKKGMTWDEILICEMLGGTEIRAERKYQRSFTFRSIATITVTGNHVPAFVTNTGPNDSGIDRRMLLLRINKLLEGNLKIDTEFSEKLVAAEGSAIMTFFVQGALEGWQSLQQTGRFLGDTARSAEAEAKKARRGSSPHLNWISERMVLERGARVNAHDAFGSFRQFVVEDNPHYRESKAEFRDALSAFTNGAVTYDRYGNERVYIGMRFAEWVTSSNVVSLFPNTGV